MQHSLSYYITMMVIKLKGLKKTFSNDPIDYMKVRSGDVGQPGGRFYKKNILRKFTISDTEITEVGDGSDADHLVIFIHGGAFISGPAQHHWNVMKQISMRTGHRVWMCNYPKAPEYDISHISENIDLVYSKALEIFPSHQIMIVGDSVGGTLSAALVQRLISSNRPVPRKVILVSPVMDSSMTNPDIGKVEVQDPMLSKAGVLSAKRMCAGSISLKNPMLSPIFGSFKEFPETTIFIAEHDITYPDQLKAIKKMEAANIDLKIIIGKRMPHIWPFLPVMKEAKVSLDKVIDILKRDTH